MRISPVLTEKSTKLIEDSNTYMFAVIGTLNKVNKISFAQMIEKQYEVEVVKINSDIRLGKPKKAGKKRTTYYTPDQKFFYVKLKDGQSIADFNVSTTEGN